MATATQLVGGQAETESGCEPHRCQRGPAKDLIERIAGAKERLRADLAAAEPAAPLRVEPPADYVTTKPDLTQGAALLRVLEELAQHHGLLEISRDVIRAQAATSGQ